MNSHVQHRPYAVVNQSGPVPVSPIRKARSGSSDDELRKRRIERVILAMRHHLGVPMNNQEMADIACLSPCHFNRVFHRVTGIPPAQFHSALRMQRAKELLIDTELSITDVCFEVGYNSLGTFITRFNQSVGLSPGAYRRFVRRLAPTHLADIAPRLQDLRQPIQTGAFIRGTIRFVEALDGPTFVALFRQAIPEGRPVACVLTTAEQEYIVPLPNAGHWYIFSVRALWTTKIGELLTLDGMPQGRTSVLACEPHVFCDMHIDLNSPNVFNPPALMSLPLLITRLLGGHDKLGCA